MSRPRHTRKRRTPRAAAPGVVPAADETAMPATDETAARAADATAARAADETAAPAADAASPVDDVAEAGPASWIERFFIPAAIGILLLAAAMRLPELGLNPFHHDEGVNGWFTSNLVRSGTYTYDPNNYHGPSLYYLALVSEILLGLTDTAMRLVPVLFGLATIAIVLSLRSVLGSLVVLAAALLLTVSPGMVYVSRYFIHEMLLVAGTIGFVGSVLLYLRSGRPAFVITGAVALALMATTKESWIIELGVLGIAAAVSVVYVNVRSGRPPFGSTVATSRSAPRSSTSKKKPRTIWVDGVQYRATDDEPTGSGTAMLAGRSINLELLAAGAIVFACIYVLLFSSLFTNFPKGITDSFAAFLNWAETGGQTQQQPIYQYLEWMLQGDAPILILGTVGGLFAAIRGRDTLWVFIGLWALGITLAYSMFSYKTPWIAVNMLLPLALLGGLALREIAALRGPVRLVAPLALVVAVGWSTYQAIDLNFTHYDDDASPYVFVHSTRELFDLLDEIDALGAELGTGAETGISIVSPDYWPLPWYLRDHPRAGFWGFLDNGTTNVLDKPEPLVIANANQRAEAEAAIGDSHELVGTYLLRPGVELDLYVQTGAAEVRP